MFDHFDRRLSCSAREAELLSPYTILSVALRRDLARRILQAAEQADRVVKRAGFEAVDEVNRRMGEAIYTFLWRRSPFAMMAAAVGLRVFTMGRRSLRAVVAVLTMAALDLRNDSGLHIPAAA